MRKKKKNKNNQDAIDDWTDKNKSANRVCRRIRQSTNERVEFILRP